MADADVSASEEDDANEPIDTGDPGDPGSAKAWLTLIKRAEKAFDEYQLKSDNIDRLFANLSKLANGTRDREFQLFWANIQVLGPSIYSRPPVPVVVPAFKDKRPLNRLASELLERCSITAYRMEDIDSVMRLVRDDLNIVGRGAVWLRYDTNDGEEVCIEHTDRGDFLHDPARKWKDVDWVSKRSWLTRKEARKRFRKTSGDEYQNASYMVRKDDDNEKSDGKLKAGFWELWSISADKVVWVAEGCEKLLDSGKPHLDLEGFFPCPRPAYGTTQRRSLIPVPDVLFYKDQLEEINEITARISALSESLKLKGFYPAGAGEIGDAIEAAIKSTTNNAILIPIANWAALGGGAAKDAIMWLPIEMVAETITGLIEVRKQLIEDVYQITGLSDIMRGDTDANETLGAQQLKSQYGSIRVHDKQQELVRIARDITRLAGEIMAENFSAKTLLDMSQMEIPSNADIAKQVGPLKKELTDLVAQVKHASTDPETKAMAAKNPDAAKQIIEQAQQHAQGLQGQIQKLEQTVTIEQVMKFLRDNRMRPFTLDIETDSTIAPDEAAQQQRANEFVKSVGGYLAQAVPLVEQIPQAAPVVASLLKFVASQFRVGREIEGTIDEFADSMAEIAQQPKGPSPETMKAQADAQATQAANQLASQKLQMDGAAQQQEAKLDAANLQIQQQKGLMEAQKAAADIKLASLQLILDKQIAQSDALIAQQKNENEAIKHHSIETTKRQAMAVDAVVSITDAELAAKSANDSQMLTAQFEQIADLNQQQHEKDMQAADQEHQAALQESAQAAAAAQPTPGA